MASKLFDLTGKTAVVVGGTSGIGLAMALGLADAGADVVASSRRAEQVEETAAAIEAKGVKTLRLTSDVVDRASLQALHDGVIQEFGKVDILINSAGKIKRAPTVDFPEELWDDIFDTKHQYRVVEYVCEPEGSDGVCVLEGGGGRADEVAGGGVELEGRDGECDCAGGVPHGAEC